ncbi:MAG: T9SS type A sorting domain-containing protein [Flavipsychrobacter sp.]|nr:T9SS type A sorting domain-containing protein [Flavipsychrobacter sp.]
MKRKLFTLIACLYISSGQLNAQSLIHYWDFNNTGGYTHPVPPSSLALIPTDYTDTLLTGHAGAISYLALSGTTGNALTYYTTAPGDTVNIQHSVTNAAGNAVSFQNPSDSMEARFYVPSTGYKDVIFNFGGQVNNGAYHLQFSYSLDSGAHWLTTGIKSVNGVPFQTFDSLTSAPTFNTVVFDSTVGDNNKLVIRVTFSGSPLRTSGSTVFDNVSLVGTPFKAAVANISSSNSKIILYPNPASKTINIKTASPNNKNVKVYSTTGKEIFHFSAYGQNITLPINDLPSGMYYILLYEPETGKQYDTKFIKE